FQCSVRVWNTVPAPLVVWKSPTAQTSFAEMAVTPASRLFCALALGVVTTDQLRPFQCSMRVCATPVEGSDLPTAHTSGAETAAIPEMLAPETAGLLATRPSRPLQGSPL